MPPWLKKKLRHYPNFHRLQGFLKDLNFNFKKNFDMKTVIVTGVSGNLGQAVAKKFLDEGCRVVGTVVHTDPAKMKIAHSNFETSAVDLMDEEEAEKFVAQVVERYNRIDVAVLTVGGVAMGAVADTKMADMLKQYQLNFQTTYQVARPRFMQMLKQGDGRIFLPGRAPGWTCGSAKEPSLMDFQSHSFFAWLKY